MKVIDSIIDDIIEVRNSANKSWIIDDNGEIKADCFVGDVIPFLNEMKYYEIDFSEEFLNEIFAKGEGDNTYNWNSNISNEIDYVSYDDKENECAYVAFRVHRYGDVRANYTDWAICKFEYDTQMFTLESAIQSKDIDDEYSADIDIFAEEYSVYNSDGLHIGDFYDIEKEYLLKSIAEVVEEMTENE